MRFKEKRKLQTAIKKRYEGHSKRTESPSITAYTIGGYIMIIQKAKSA
jgi:hypothetical protein